MSLAFVHDAGRGLAVSHLTRQLLAQHQAGTGLGSSGAAPLDVNCTLARLSGSWPRLRAQHCMPLAVGFEVRIGGGFKCECLVVLLCESVVEVV